MISEPVSDLRGGILAELEEVNGLFGEIAGAQWDRKGEVHLAMAEALGKCWAKAVVGQSKVRSLISLVERALPGCARCGQDRAEWDDAERCWLCPNCADFRAEERMCDAEERHADDRASVRFATFVEW